MPFWAPPSPPRSEGVPLRLRGRDGYSAEDVQWADTIFSLGGDGNFLYTASKVLTPEKLVIGELCCIIAKDIV